MLKALLYAYVLGGLTFVPLVVLGVVFVTIYTSVPVGDGDVTKAARWKLESKASEDKDGAELGNESQLGGQTPRDTNDLPRARKGWLTMRRTFEEPSTDGGYVNLVRSFLDSRSKDPKKSRPKDMWYVVLKGKVLYLYEDEEMTECEAVVELGSHDVVIYPEGQMDGELFAKRNAICLKLKNASVDKVLPTATKYPKSQEEDIDGVSDSSGITGRQNEREKPRLNDVEKQREAARERELNSLTQWFIFVRSNVEMEDWYLALVHASGHPPQTPTLSPLEAVFHAADMDRLVHTLDEQPDVIPMRWLNALIGRIFFSYYRTHVLEAYIIGRLMKKLSKVKRPTFLTDVVVTEVSVGNKAPMLSKPMLKELTREGDASLEVHLQYKGEFRITVEATAIINLGQFKSYTVKLVLAVVIRELEGNLLIKVKRPPSNRIWYAFTQNPRMVLEVEPIVSDRQIKWGMILGTIESKLKEIIQESVVLPNMDDIAFFESLLYQHRGGIWSDASRLERLGTRLSMLANDDMRSTVSAPTAIPSDAAPENSSLPVEAVNSLSESESDRSRPASVIPIVKETPMREQESASHQDGSLSMQMLEEELRNRSSDVLPVATFSSDIPPDICIPNENETDPPVSDPQASHSRRSSMHSAKSHRSRKSTDSTLEPSVTTPRGDKASNASSNSPGSSNPGSPSFLSTLKSKAGDKQALSNTAREAMRKWGVNWGNLKKELVNSEENEDPVSRLRSKADNVSNKRSSYAEVRAAVAERRGRERERNGESEEEANLSRSTSPAGDPKGENVDSNPAAMNQGTQLTSFLGQTGHRSITPRLTPKKSLPSTSRVMNTDIDTTDDISGEEVRPVPIQAQPQAKTMTIPGIHASRKGEAMSMGYVAPQPSLVPDSVKSKKPAMYRLWGSPVNAGQGPDVPAPRTPSLAQAASEAQSSQPHSPLLQEPATARPKPPPLPPRSTPGSATRSNDGLVDRDHSEAAPLAEPVKPKGGSTVLPDKAVTFLSDEMILDTSTAPPASTPPPLPPRRIPSTA